MKMVFVALLAASLLLSGCAQAPVNEGMTADGRAYRGAAEPKLVIYEYSDFECPFCARVQPTLERVVRAYGEKGVQLQFRHSPLGIHPHAFDAAVAGVCAEKQGKFWQMHNKMYDNQVALDAGSLERYAVDAGLDIGAFKACAESTEAEEAVSNDMAMAASLGIAGTPTFIIGRSEVEGAQPYEKFQQAIDAELATASR